MMHCVSGRGLFDGIYRGTDAGTEEVNTALLIQSRVPVVIIAEGLSEMSLRGLLRWLPISVSQ